MTNIDIYRKRIRLLIIMSVSPLLAAGPFLIGILGASLTPGCNESNCAWGVLPWFSFFTAPAALILFIMALIQFFMGLRNRLTKTNQEGLEERRLRIFYFAWMIAATGPLLLAGVLVMAVQGGPVSICDTNDVCTQTGTGVFVDTALKVSPFLLGFSWLYLIGLWIWNKFRKTAEGT